MMNSEEFIEVAGRIAGMGKGGARSAVSRAYYGAFHLAISVLEELGCAPGRAAKSHNVVPNLLLNSQNEHAHSAGGLLADLHADRVKADYRLDHAVVETEEFAQVSVETALEIKRHLEIVRRVCRDEGAKRRIQQVIRDYRRKTNQ